MAFAEHARKAPAEDDDEGPVRAMAGALLIADGLYALRRIPRVQ